jgi:putative photosynthetic complex assembly protein 2
VSQIALAVAFTVFVWWFSTGAILYLDGLPRRTFKWTMTGATVLLGLALAGLSASSAVTTVAGAYCAFACAVLVWGWQEVAFLLGYVTGPRRTPCPAGSEGWQRAGHALQTILHHEFALFALALAVLTVTWDRPNQTGWWTFVILWAMRQSAKLNVFLGVRNLNEDFLPEHLAYLQTYFARKPMNNLWPISVGAGSLLALPLWQGALAPIADNGFDTASFALLATLLSLALLEHLLLVLPLPAAVMWKWGMRSHLPNEQSGT